MDKRIEKTRNAIEAAYFELIGTNNGKRISVSDIARTANIDRKTFYLHYETPEDILESFCRRQMGKLADELKKEHPENRPFTMLGLFSLLNKVIADNMELMEVLSCNDNNNIFFDVIKQTLIKAIASDYRDMFPYSDTELRVYSEFFISGILSAYRLWLRNEVPVSIDDLALMIRDAALDGLDSLSQRDNNTP